MNNRCYEYHIHCLKSSEKRRSLRQVFCPFLLCVLYYVITSSEYIRKAETVLHCEKLPERGRGHCEGTEGTEIRGR